TGRPDELAARRRQVAVEAVRRDALLARRERARDARGDDARPRALRHDRQVEIEDAADVALRADVRERLLGAGDGEELVVRRRDAAAQREVARSVVGRALAPLLRERRERERRRDAEPERADV